MVAARAHRTDRALREALTALDAEDRKFYQSIPEKLEYVAHPSFSLPATQRRLFGPDAEPITVPGWRQYPLGEDETGQLSKASRVLSHRQEALLFLRYNYARYRLAGLMRAQRRRFARSRIAEILTWCRRVLCKRAALVNANMALVVAMAKRTGIEMVEFGELVSEGNMALLRAVDKFDVRRGFKFSTYACRAILKGFSRLASKTGTYRRHFPAEFDPAVEHTDELERRHVDQRALAVEDLRRVLSNNMAELTEPEREVVAARFGVAGHPRTLTLEQVGRLVGLSKERVRQVQNRALAKLRAALDEQAA